MVLKKALYEPGNDIFLRTAEESARTVCILGRSFSGKTFFLVQNLNALAGRLRGGSGKSRKQPMYDLIILFSESLSAEPLEGLDPSLNVIFIAGYIPQIVQLLKKINDASNNAFRFLVILDDVVTGIRSGTMAKQILTMRNSQISTSLLIQYVKLISPAMRNSIHDYFITGLKPEEWSYLLQSFLSSLVKELIGNQPSNQRLAEEFKRWVKKDIVHYDQRHDVLTFIERNF